MKKIKIELNFCNWKTINVKIFNIVVTVDELFVLEGIMFYDVKREKHIIDDQLIYMLRQKNIDKRIILKALSDRNYNFEIDQIQIEKEEHTKGYKYTIIAEDFDYSWNKKEEEIIENRPQLTFDFEK